MFYFSKPSNKPAMSSTSGPATLALRPGPSRSLQTSPGGLEHARPPAEPQELRRPHEQGSCTRDKTTPTLPHAREVLEKQLEPTFNLTLANARVGMRQQLADERDRTMSPALRRPLHAPGPKLYG